MISEVTKAFRSKQTINPRTVLGFYATVLGLLFAAVVGAVAVLAGTKTATYLIPWLLGFMGLVVLLLLGGVFVITLNDPSKLMLGQISGTEYVAVQQAIVGDSTTGKKVVTLARGMDDFSVEVTAATSQALPPPANEEQEE